MRHPVSFAVTVTLAIAAAITPSHAQQKVMLGHATTSTVSIRMFASVGDVRVVGWDRDSVEISGTVPNGARVEMPAGAPQERSTGLKLFIESPPDQPARDGHLVLHVPRGARVWLKAGSADMDVAGVSGGLDLNIVGGSVTVHGSPREVRVESMDGNVIIDGSPEWLRVKTATGDITLHGGRDVGASTISGTIHSIGGDVERVKLESTTGGITFESGLVRGASLELETHSGAIVVALPAHTDVDVDLATITGTIDNQWSRARPVAGREGRGMTLVTSNGGSAGRVSVRSFKGTVQLTPR